MDRNTLNKAPMGAFFHADFPSNRTGMPPG